MSTFATSIYNTILRRNTVFLGTIFVSAFGLGLAFDGASNKIWDSVNRGRQWKDIRHRYIAKADDDDE